MNLSLQSQNLNERKNKVVGSMFWHGRAWIRSAGFHELFHIEWLLGRHAHDFGLTATFGCGDSDSERGICLHVGIPWIASIYLVLPKGPRCRESQTGVAIHNQAIWFYPWADQNESRSDHPWWRKNYSWHFPWELNWQSTEILKPIAGVPSSDWPVVWSESKGSGKREISSYEIRRVHEASVSETHPYTYTRKSGDKQNVQATVNVDRMRWRARWWPLIFTRKVRTSINVHFSAEVGDGEGSWKGGCVGCGWEMIEGETPLECLRRMERERRFDR